MYPDGFVVDVTNNETIQIPAPGVNVVHVAPAVAVILVLGVCSIIYPICVEPNEDNVE
jgi:hypothetical protein